MVFYKGYGEVHRTFRDFCEQQKANIDLIQIFQALSLTQRVG